MNVGRGCLNLLPGSFNLFLRRRSARLTPRQCTRRPPLMMAGTATPRDVHADHFAPSESADMCCTQMHAKTTQISMKTIVEITFNAQAAFFSSHPMNTMSRHGDKCQLPYHKIQQTTRLEQYGTCMEMQTIQIISSRSSSAELGQRMSRNRDVRSDIRSHDAICEGSAEDL